MNETILLRMFLFNSNLFMSKDMFRLRKNEEVIKLFHSFLLYGIEICFILTSLEEQSIFSLINVHLCKSLQYPLLQLPETHPLESVPPEDKAVIHTKTEIVCIDKNSPCVTAGFKNTSAFSIAPVSRQSLSIRLKRGTVNTVWVWI